MALKCHPNPRGEGDASPHHLVGAQHQVAVGKQSRNQWNPHTQLGEGLDDGGGSVDGLTRRKIGVEDPQLVVAVDLADKVHGAVFAREDVEPGRPGVALAALGETLASQSLDHGEDDSNQHIGAGERSPGVPRTWVVVEPP